ncbi:DUF371 domain-containing protein [Candidatus Bathyarchaeota archaeon]|nr:DUF371 domain-containing protein [Candidatus Bathyarchaeota archaeon]
MLIEDFFSAQGHPNIQGTHKTTIMTTKEQKLTLKGDCIIAVKANKGLVDLKKEVKLAAKNSDSIIKVILSIEDEVVEISGHGDPNLTYEHPHDIVIRKSSFICPRTLMIKADKASIDLPRKFVSKMKNPESLMKILIRVTVNTY